MAPPAKACTACRLRKVKCPGVEDGQLACATCIRLAIKCQFTAVKRGRPLAARTREALAVAQPTLSAAVPQPEPVFRGAPLGSDDVGIAEHEQGPLAVIISGLEEAFPRNSNSGTAHSNSGKVFFEKPDNDQAFNPVSSGLLSEEQAKQLYDLFVKRMNGYTGLLDPALHTFDYVSSRSAFLLSVCLQVAAARSLRTDGIAKQLLLHIRETLWPNVLVRNLRSVAICQACMIWGSFADTSDISDDETTWFLFGHALRMSVELGLSRDLQAATGHSAHDKAVLRDAQRCWLTCYIADRSWAAMTSRPPLIMENPLTLSAQHWLADACATTDDASIAALVDYRRILERMPSLSDANAYRAHTAFEGLTRDLLIWEKTWSGDQYASCKRLSVMTSVYYQYAMCLVHSRRLSLGDCKAATDLKGAASALIAHAAEVVPGEEVVYAHNSFYTMLLYGFHCCYRFREASTDESHLLQPDQEALKQTIACLNGQFYTSEKAGSGALNCLRRLRRLQEGYNQRSPKKNPDLSSPPHLAFNDHLKGSSEAAFQLEGTINEIPVPFMDNWEQTLLPSDPLALFQQETFDFWASLGLNPDGQMSL